MTAASALDQETTAAIRDAISAARTGRLSDAIRIGERALADGGNAPALNAMLGTLLCQSGDRDAGIRHLREAFAGRPDDPIIATNLVTALAQECRHGEALALLSDEVANIDPSLHLQRVRGFLAQEAGDLPAAIKAYEKVVSAHPEDWETWNNLGNAFRLGGDAENSVNALTKAARLNPGSAPVRLNQAMALAAAGQIEEAIEVLRLMAEDFPQDATPLRELYAILKELGREEEALEAITAAYHRQPADLELAITVAGQQLNVLKPEDAEQTYRKILEADPMFELATLGLAVVFELANRTDELFQLAEDGKGSGVGKDVLNFIQAMGHRRARRFEEGLTTLKSVPESLESIRRFHLLGQLEEGAGHFEEAFSAFTTMNELQSRDLTNPTQRAAAYREGVRRQRDTLLPKWRDNWRPADVHDERATPAFIVGFPRSGTTLLDTMLMGHPRVEVLEEEPALLEASKSLHPFEDLATADEDKIRDARDIYFRVAAERTPLESGKLVIDKNPLNLNAIPLIHRLFPDARVILALRHPCDAVFSCFASNFKLNDGMSSFLQLDTAAELYGLSFSYFEKARGLLGREVHEIRYEDVVEDRERELRALIQYLGLDWSDEVLDHEATAQSRGRVKTPSYHQVIEPVYDRSIGRWRNYKGYLAPILPELKPWVDRFGYDV